MFIIIVIIFSSCKTPNQGFEKIDNIEFSYYSGLRIPYNEVIINLERNSEQAIVYVHSKPLNEKPEWKYSKIDTVLFIDIKIFNKFAKSAISLDKIDINKAQTIGLDGYTCKIDYGAKGKNNSYRFWSPTSNTKERGLSEFVNLCIQILDISTLKRQEIMQ